MNSKTKTILIIVCVAILGILAYIFIVKPSDENTDSLTSSSQLPIVGGVDSLDNSSKKQETSVISKDFLSVLLSVKGLKINDSIFSDPAFNALKDSSIILTPTQNEGRTNPFAPIGADSYVSNPVSVPSLPSNQTTTPSTTAPTTVTPTTPAPTTPTPTTNPKLP